MADSDSAATHATQRQACDLIPAVFGPGLNGPLTLVVHTQPGTNPKTAASAVAATVKIIPDVLTVAGGNLLATVGRLSGIIDFGSCGVGDPVVDLVMAWSYFHGEERGIFADAVGLDADTWRRARGWALWKALATMAGLSSPDPEGFQARVLVHVLADPVVD